MQKETSSNTENGKKKIVLLYGLPFKTFIFYLLINKLNMKEDLS